MQDQTRDYIRKRLDNAEKPAFRAQTFALNQVPESSDVDLQKLKTYFEASQGRHSNPQTKLGPVPPYVQNALQDLQLECPEIAGEIPPFLTRLVSEIDRYRMNQDSQTRKVKNKNKNTSIL
jgi:hypothetical protein